MPHRRLTRRARRVGAAIFTASMADVVFLLIVFFVLTYRVTLDPTRMELPKTLLRNHVPDGAALISIAPPEGDQVVRVSTGAERAVAISGDEEMLSFAANLVAADPDRVFVVRADHRVRYERIDTVLQTLRDARAREVYLLSDQRTID